MKWFILKLVVAIIIATTFMGCTKFGKNITVKGRVLNPITGEGYAGAIITLKKPSVSLKYNGPGDKPFKEVKTDENGYFEISAMRLSTHITAVCGYGGYQEYYTLGWYDNGKYTYSLVLDKGKTMHVDYHLVPYGKLQINIKNTNCFNQNDSLIIMRESSIPGFYDEVPNPAMYIGCYELTGNLNNAPMGFYKYNGKIVKNGVITPIKDSIYLSAGETKIWNIYY